MYLISYITSTKKPKPVNRLKILFSCCHFDGLDTYAKLNFSQNCFYSPYKIEFLNQAESHISGFYILWCLPYLEHSGWSKLEGFSWTAKGIGKYLMPNFKQSFQKYRCITVSQLSCFKNLFLKYFNNFS